MATAGERYEERTGNAWSYANRGDITGLKAALARGVDVNITNTVGWTPCHAAAAGGQNKALRLLVKAGADLSIVDRGGDTPAHQAAKNGHVHALRVLQELGADITRVRLSQCKGKATRDLLADAYRKAGRTALLDGEEGDDAPVVVGYARKQSKSTAFWGPRRTPISCKIKKKIIKDRRQRKGERSGSLVEDKDEGPSSDKDEDSSEHLAENELSYVETVRQIKRNKKQKRRQKQGKKTDQHCDLPQPTQKSDLGSEFVEAVAKEQAEGTITESSDDEHGGISEDDACEDDDTGGLRFADLMLFDDSDSE
mmetsp:Transcript_23159/g.42598  ORF Transcript_23159/g.42598 Transcript_23159/m.42598 type:complete len:310 (+) Transcript_23159:46-975(+)|eukprot:CAMPEP_0202007370 /NCGR_PEP_ID=MMETSP0905-20130828/11880_1 /ASSEMBLY_ACC=CAM_ASM_000554 /TAXON_ID=420261 /ORGANISM="Thalassiosira antarctica, Strain CCMP982" /LENGTH=309 /DNA_ID=CAMNT_0048565317 /DNA_START=16 /DNA_END=945 /DNA_ORIENTATION=+